MKALERYQNIVVDRDLILSGDVLKKFGKILVTELFSLH